MPDASQLTIDPNASEQFDRALKDIFLDGDHGPLHQFQKNDLIAWLRDDWRIISLFGKDDAFETHPCLSKTFTDLARRGSRFVAAATLDMDVEQPDGVSWRSKSIVRTAADGFLTALCPFTGERRRVDHTIGRDWLFIKHGQDFCLASNMGGVMVDVNLETVWVFPIHKLILKTNMLMDENAVLTHTSHFFENIFLHPGLVREYLNRPILEKGDGVSISDFSCPHMSHNLWNIQTGWFNIFEKASPASFKSILNFRGQNFFGSLYELYAEEMKGAPPVVEVANDCEVFVHSLKTGGVMLCVKDEMFRPGFAEKLLARARTQCSAEFLEHVAQLRATCNPLVVTTVRLDNREWIEQRAGFPKLFTALRGDFPSLGVIVDGLSSDTAKGWTTSWMSMQQELEVADLIRAETPADMPVEFAVGRTFAEALLLCDAADCFIAPSGSGMGLYKWISNMPGLAFSNTSILSPSKDPGARFSLTVWHNQRYRHDITPTIHIAPELVVDGPTQRNSESRANFHLDWTVLYGEAKRFLLELPPRTTRS